MKNDVIIPAIRGVAQPGRVLGLGPRCRRFEPSHHDHKIQIGICADFNFMRGFRRSIPCNEIAAGSTMSKRERVKTKFEC